MRASRAAVTCVVHMLVIAVQGCEGTAPRDLSEAQLSRVVDEQRPTLETCYNAALEKTPYKHEVRMAAVIHIAPEGKVDSVEVEGTGLPGMPGCVRDAIQVWTFPAAPESTHTRLPIVFSPQLAPTPAAPAAAAPSPPP